MKAARTAALCWVFSIVQRKDRPSRRTALQGFTMGALEMGLAEEELQPLVSAWRDSNPNITEFWWAVDRTVKECIKKRMPTETHGIRFDYQSGMLFITLFSGRRLAYVKPRIGENQFGGESVTYMGVGGTKKWERLESYGPKFVENIVQAVSRDILCYAMRTLRNGLFGRQGGVQFSQRSGNRDGDLKKAAAGASGLCQMPPAAFFCAWK